MSDLKDFLGTFFQKSRLPVLFAGAGVSARAGLPAWSAYLRALGAAAAEYDEYTKFFIDKAVSEGALSDAATYYMLCRQMPEASKLRELVRPLENFNADALASLVQLPFQAVATTNYDRALFSAYAKYVGKAPAEVNIDDPTIEAAGFSDSLYVARIHGRIEVPSSIRLASAELAALEHNAAYQRYLEHLFTRRQVLFLGFSFLDPAIVAVLRAVRTSSRSMHGQEHFALVPSDASADFLLELEKHSIRKVLYDPREHHRELWDAIWEYSNDQHKARQAHSDVRDVPFAVARKYLATAFARARMGRQREPLAQAIAEGIVSGIIQNANEGGVSESDLVSRLVEELSLNIDAARSLVAQATTSLGRDGLCKVESDAQGHSIFRPQKVGVALYDSAIERLIDGCVNRYVLTERGTDSPEVRLLLKDLFGLLLLERGWELGAAYAARRMPEDVDVGKLVDSLDARNLRPSELSRLIRSIENILTRPDDEEAEILAELGRTAFGLELLLEAPHDAAFLRRTLPEKIYFDANVVMPAITPGHSHYELLSSTINALRDSGSGAMINISLRIYDGFLNEVVSHKRLAREAMSSNGGEGALWEARSVGLHGSANVNVFVGAYFNYKEEHLEISFEDFLHLAAPYDDETSLRRYLTKLGFEVVRENQTNRREFPELLHALEKFYAAKLEIQRKSAVVIRHDAVQLSILNADLHSGSRSMLVSADKGLRFALEYEGYSSIASSMMTHLGLAQLVDLLIGRMPASRGLASLLWMSPVSTDTSRIRSYLVSLALKEHAAALAMNMSQVVDEIAEDAGMELARKRLQLEANKTSDRVAVNTTLERYEARFFSKMRKEVEKLEARYSD
jgi:hypothetical protein